MYQASLQQIDPADPKWGPPPPRPPDVFMSVPAATGDEPASQLVRRWPGSLIAYDWTVEGREESLRPEDPFDTSDIDTLAIEEVDRVRFEIHSAAIPTSITVMRIFDLGAENPSDFDPVLEWLALGNSEPEGHEVVFEEADGGGWWRLDIQSSPMQEASYVVLQARWSGILSLGSAHHSASWAFGIRADSSGKPRAERVAIRDRKHTESGIKKPTVGDGGPIQWRADGGTRNFEENLDSMMTSPVGRAFATVGARSGMSPEDLAVPQTSVWLCAAASDEIEVWRGDRNDLLVYLDKESPKHREFLRDVMKQDGASWWFEPLDRDRQIWVSDDGSLPERESLIVPSEPSDGWELYAQKTKGGLFTSTLIGDTSPMSAAICSGVGDFRPGFGTPPYGVWRMVIDDAARILEIHSAHDWHSLCVRYPASGDERHPGATPDFSDTPGRLEADWSKVAVDWDAVHLSFGGYLTTDQVRVESESGWTYHWAWHCECTLWLRWMFTSFERVEDHHDTGAHLDFGQSLFFAMMDEA